MTIEEGVSPSPPPTHSNRKQGKGGSIWLKFVKVLKERMELEEYTIAEHHEETCTQELGNEFVNEDVLILTDEGDMENISVWKLNEWKLRT